MQRTSRRRSDRFLLSFLLLLGLLLFSFGFLSCSDPKDHIAAHEKKLTQGCAECHTDRDLLAQLAEEEPQSTGDSGEG